MPTKKKRKPVASQTKAPSRLPKILLGAGVIFLAVLILVTKQQIANAPAEAAVGASTGVSAGASGAAPVVTELPEVQLTRALENGEPTLAFFHSLNCAACKEMTATVEQVHPEFADSITLVDVDVFDRRNESLVDSAGIRAIPTVIFYDRNGAVEVRMGAMKPAELRSVLNELQGDE